MRRSSILELPEGLRRELNAKLVAKGFSDYDGLELWLSEKLEASGLELSISRSAIHRHGQKFEDKLEKLRIATEQAKAISDGAEDDEGAMSDALIRLVQSKTFDVLMAIDDEDGKPVDLSKIGTMIARLTRAQVRQKEWMIEIRDKLDRKKQAVAATVEKLTKGKGLSKEVAEAIRAEILGLDLNNG